MNQSIWMYFFMLMGILGIFLINLFGQVIISNEQNYYLLKEITEAAMIDAVDLTAYRDGIGYDGVTYATDDESMHCIAGVPGTIRIVKDKFLESFIRRFAESADLDKKYTLVFNDIDECPPKVSVTIVSNQTFDFLGMYNVSYDSEGQDSARILNEITGILENRTPPTTTNE